MINTSVLFQQALHFEPGQRLEDEKLDSGQQGTATRESELEQSANAQLAKLIAKSSNSFDGINLQSKFCSFLIVRSFSHVSAGRAELGSEKRTAAVHISESDSPPHKKN